MRNNEKQSQRRAHAGQKSLWHTGCALSFERRRFLTVFEKSEMETIDLTCSSCLFQRSGNA